MSRPELKTETIDEILKQCEQDIYCGVLMGKSNVEPKTILTLCEALRQQAQHTLPSRQEFYARCSYSDAETLYDWLTDRMKGQDENGT